MRTIDDGTWVPPPENNHRPNALVLRNQDQEFKKTPRFDPKTLPKYKAEQDLEHWLMEMDQQIDTHGETLVCPLIAWNCFPQDDLVRIWYTMLGGQNHANMTKEPGCWFNFQVKMRETWSKSIAVTQREAEDRSKQKDETFLIYYFQKLRLLTTAFPESREATHIVRIRAKFNDAQADRYIREHDSLAAFASEIRRYDDHIKLHPPTTKYVPSYFGPSYRPSNTTNPSDSSITSAAPNISGQNPNLKPRLTLPVNNKEKTRERDKSSEYNRRMELHIKSIAERKNPTTGKYTRSFLRADGIPKFIERPCEFCDKMGKKEQWHFGFECEARKTIHAMWMETMDSDSDRESSEEEPTSTSFTIMTSGKE